jgi:putative toxin-antitoxin system antitoxin component (TIGR02293 family)
MTVSAIAEVLGGRKSFRKHVETSFDLVQVTRAGLPVGTIDTIASELATPRVAVAKILGISERTLSRRATAHERLTAEESDRAVRLARVLALAKETLGDREKAGRWLQTPNRALDGERPFDRLDTDAGVRSVEQILGRIAYGVYS